MKNNQQRAIEFRTIAKFIEVSSDSVENADKLGSVITRLGNNFATTENAILSNATEIQKGVAVYNTSAQGVLALGAATEALGSQSEASRSAIQLTFNVIDKAITTGEGLEEILRLTGLTEKQLSEQFQKDATGVFQKFIKGLSDAKDEGRNLREILSGLDLDERRSFTVVGALASNYDVLGGAIRQASEEYEENTALIKEADAASESLASRIDDVKDSFSNTVTEVDSGDGFFSRLTREILNLTEATLDFIRVTNGQGLGAGVVAFSKGAVDFSEFERSFEKSKNQLRELFQRGIFVEFESGEFKELEKPFISSFRIIEDLSEENARKRFELFKGELNAIRAAQESGLTDVFKLIRESNSGGSSSTPSGDDPIENQANTVEDLTQKLKDLREARKNSVPLSEENLRLNREIKETQDLLNAALGRTVARQKQLAEEGSLQSLKDQLSELRKELQSENLEGSELENKIQEIVDKEEEVQALIDKFKVLQAVAKRNDGDLAEPASIGSSEGLPSEIVSLNAEENAEKQKQDIALKFAEQTEEAKEDIRERYRREELEKEQQQEEAKAELRKAIFSGLQSGFDTVFEIANNQLDQQTNSRLQAVELEYNRRIEAAEGNTAEQERLEEELEARREAIQKKAFQDKQKLSIRQALINGAIAATQALANTTLPFPVSLTALIPIAVQTAAQVAVIRSQKFAEEGIRIDSQGNVISDSGKTVGNWVGLNDQPKVGRNNITTRHVLEHGGRLTREGLFEGRSHKEGGIDTVINGVPVNVERGEFADVDETGAVNVINKRSSKKFRSRLLAINGKVYPGKAKELSAINSYSGYGRKLAAMEGIRVENRDLTNSVLRDSRSSNVAAEVGMAVKSAMAQMTPILAEQVGEKTYQGSFGGSNQGTNQGLTTSNKENLREANLRARTKA